MDNTAEEIAIIKDRLLDPKYEGRYLNLTAISRPTSERVFIGKKHASTNSKFPYWDDVLRIVADGKKPNNADLFAYVQKTLHSDFAFMAKLIAFNQYDPLFELPHPLPTVVREIESFPQLGRNIKEMEKLVRRDHRTSNGSPRRCIDDSTDSTRGVFLLLYTDRSQSGHQERIGLWIPDPASMYRANVDGTRELLRLARESAVKRFVYTSSVATMHFRTDGIVINEDTPVSLADMVGHYKRSKFMAEQEAIKAAQGGQQVIILNPTTPIGSNDRKPTPTGRIVVDFLNGKFPAYMDTGMNLVDVSEVARAHVLALTNGTPGKRYILGGENLTLKQILDKMAAITGIPSPTVKIPFVVAATYAFFEEWITGRIRGKEPRASLEEVRMGRKKMFASSARAEQELGFQIKPVYPAMRAAIDWFRANGYAP